MTDSKWVYDPVGQMFDARLESLVIDGGHGRFDSVLDMSSSGVQVLLGRNGAGKSTLLDLINGIWGDQTERRVARPMGRDLNLAAVYRLPSAELLQEWTRLRVESDDPEWYENLAQFPSEGRGAELELTFALPVLHAIVRSATEDGLGRIAGSIPYRIRSHWPKMDVEETLAWLGFSPQAIKHWRKAEEMEDALNPGPRFPEEVETSDQVSVYVGPPHDYALASLSAAIFLNSLANNGAFEGTHRPTFTFIRPGDPFVEGEALTFTSQELGDVALWDWEQDSDEIEIASWFEDPVAVGSIGAAFEELIQRCDRVIIERGGYVRLLASIPQTGPLANFIQQRYSATSSVDGEDNGRSVVDPNDVIGVVEIGAERLASTRRFKFRPYNRGSSPIHRPLLGLTMDGDDPHLLDRLVAGTFDYFARTAGTWFTPSYPKVMIGEDSCESALDEFGVAELPDGLLPGGREGLEAYVSQVGEVLASCDIGVRDIRVSGLDTGKILASSQSGTGTIEWRSSFDESWLPLSAMSRGQRDALCMMLAVGPGRRGRSILVPSPFLAVSPDARRFDVLDYILLVDEFDRHLHPQAAKRLLVEVHRVAAATGVRIIVSTHSIPAVSDPDLRHAQRIFTTRTADGGVLYAQAQHADRNTMAEILGVDFLSTLQLASGFLLVEGEHEEIILSKIFDPDFTGEAISGIEIMNGRGVFSFAGIWENVLRFLDAPVFVMYDKRNEEFESEWKRMSERVLSPQQDLVSWSTSRFAEMLKEVEQRFRDRKTRKGDSELENILKLVRSVMTSEGVALSKSMSRVRFLGVECEDVVDLLPIRCFPKAIAIASDWPGVHERWAQHRSRPKEQRGFKEHFGINERSIRTAVRSMTKDDIHPELSRVLRSIRAD
jgi:energy-coupling factor transporter ATP-binding protein EcfA2